MRPTLLNALVDVETWISVSFTGLLCRATCTFEFFSHSSSDDVQVNHHDAHAYLATFDSVFDEHLIVAYDEVCF